METETDHTPGDTEPIRPRSPRRTLLKGAGLAGAAGIAGVLLHSTAASAQADTNDKVYSPLAYGAKGDGVTVDDTAIANTIAAIPPAGGILDLSGAPVSYLISTPISLPTTGGVTVIGSFCLNDEVPGNVIRSDVTCSSSFQGSAAIADAGALSMSTGTVDSSFPLTIRGLSIDLSNVPSQGSNTPTDGIRLMAFRCLVDFCYVLGNVNTGTGIRFTDANDAKTLLAKGEPSYENAARFNYVVFMGSTGIMVDRTDANSSRLTDGWIVYNLVKMSCIALGDKWSSTGAGIDCENAADWQIVGNHVYRCPNDAIIANNAWTAYICHNKVDNFGLGTTGISRGIFINNPGPPFSTIADNEVDGAEALGTSTSVFNYYEIDSPLSNAATVSMSNNGMRRVTAFAGTGLISNPLVINGSGGGGLTVRDWGFAVTSNSGVTPPGTGAAVSGPVTLLRGPLPAPRAFNPTQPTGNGTTSMEMAGIGSTCSYTPSVTSSLLIRITGVAGTDSATPASVSLQGRYGTGGAPGNLKPIAGTTFSPVVTVQASVKTATGLVGFTLEGTVTGLAVGTPYWIDFAFATGATNETAEVSALCVVVQEVN
jgi:hypothetical protein